MCDREPFALFLSCFVESQFDCFLILSIFFCLFWIDCFAKGENFVFFFVVFNSFFVHGIA